MSAEEILNADKNNYAIPYSAILKGDEERRPLLSTEHPHYNGREETLVQNTGEKEIRKLC
ncbi:hypothetical protein J7K52_00910 [Candidatus Bathyarchaeota archaeon]|nr:hypothetical protein [Candidatus Bathyarchaeota archaeon]